MKVTKTGWLATCKDSEPWRDPNADPAVEPTGIYVYYGGSYVTMQYSGVDGCDNMLFLPAEPHLLRDLAAVLEAAAKRKEQR